MSFPTVIYGPASLRWETHTTRRRELGTQLVIPDGRKFRYVRAGATALVVGDLLQAPANTANHVNLTPAIAAVNATTVTVAVGATAVVVDEYARGLLVISVTPGAGVAYEILSNPVNAGSADMIVTLAPGNAIQTALTATSRVALIRHPHSALIQHPTTRTGIAVGVAQVALAIDAYGWVQTHGLCAVLTEGTVILGNMVIPSASTAGAVAPQGAATYIAPAIGRVQRVAASGAWSTVFLDIDG